MSAKASEKNAEELQAALQALIAQGRKEGMVRSADLNAILEKMDMTPEKIEERRTKLNDMGINYLLNVGPDYLGRIPAPAADILRALGQKL